MFGDNLSSSIIAENSNDSAEGITAKIIEDNMGKICDIINDIPTYEELIKKYKILGAKYSLSDINVSDDKLDLILEYSPLVRNRLTFMRLLKALKHNSNEIN